MVCAALRGDPLVGVPGSSPPCSTCHHPGVHGSADHSCHRQQEGAQTQGVALTTCKTHISLIKLVLVLRFPSGPCWRITGLLSSALLSPQKGAGYHLDLFWVAILLVVCSFMGLPWYVAATVISIAHIDSLKMETQCSAPGEQPKFLGVR